MTKKKTNLNHRHPRKPSSGFLSRSRLVMILLLASPLVMAAVIGFGAMQFENHDSSCASCHTQPEGTYFQRESVQSPVDLASFHSENATRCIDCHSSTGSIGRVGAMMLGAKDLFAFLSKQYAQPAPLTRAIHDDHCLKCHQDLPQKREFTNHFHLLLSRWQELDPNAATCVDCHQSHTTNGEVSIQFINKESTTRICERCHGFAGAGG